LQNALPGTLVGDQGRSESGRDTSAAAGDAAGGRGAASPIGNGAVPGVVLVGQHGLERVVAGRREVDPRVAPWRAAVAAAAREAEAALPDLVVERKGDIAMNLH